MDNSIKKINITLSKDDQERINNAPSSELAVPFKEFDMSTAQIDKNALTIVNPNQANLSFAIGNDYEMKIINIDAQQIWSKYLGTDNRINFVMKTDKKILSYWIMNRKCYSIFWNKKEKSWDLKAEDCEKH